MSQFSCVPGDSQLVDHIIGELKSKGIFDQFRKECIADVDTKPAYQNLRMRVEGSVSGFLAHQKWRPDLNKNQLREKLRKHINEANYLEQGVERIVDQVVNPKVASVFIPQVEDLVYSYLGLQKPKSSENSNGIHSYTTDDTIPLPTDSIPLPTGTIPFPTDVKMVSPEPSKSNNKGEEKIQYDEIKMEIDEPVKLEIEEKIETATKSEIIHVTLADIISPDSNDSLTKEEFKEELIVTTELSNLSIDIPLPEGPPKFEKQDESIDYKHSDTETSLDSAIMRNVSPLTPIRSFNDENSCDAQPSFDERKNDSENTDNIKNTEKPIPLNTFRFTIEKDCEESELKPNKILNVDRSISYQYAHTSANNYSAPSYDDSSCSNNLQIDYQSDKDGLTTDSKQELDYKIGTLVSYDESKSKDASNDDRKKINKSSYVSKDSRGHSSSKYSRDRKSDTKYHSSDKKDLSRSHKNSSKDDTSHKSRYSSHSDKSKDRNDRDKKEPNEKNDRDKRDLAEKKEKEKNDSSKDRHTSSHKSSNKDSKSKHHTSSSSKHHSTSSTKEEKKSSGSRNDDKNRHHSSSKSSTRDHSRHNSHHRSDRDKYKSSSSKDKENRDKDKKEDKKDSKVIDDHYSVSGRGNRTRRSTDRDSNDGNSSSSKGSTLVIGVKTSNTTNDHKSSSSKSDNQTNGGDSTSQSDATEMITQTENYNEKSEEVDSNKSLKPVLKLESQLKTPVIDTTPLIIDKVASKKPMIADNMNEAIKLMKVRKQMAAEEEKKRQEATLLIEFQEKIHSSISQVYSGISGPELEFACFQKDFTCIKNKQTVIQNDDASENCKYIETDMSNDNIENFPLKVQKEIITNIKVDIEEVDMSTADNIHVFMDSGKNINASEDIEDEYLNFVCGDPKKDLDLQYFSQREIYNTEMDKENFKKIFKSLENVEVTKTAFLLNCDHCYESLIKECYNELGLNYKIVNINHPKQKNIPKKLNTEDLAKKELILPAVQHTFNSDIAVKSDDFNPDISIDSMDGCIDYEKNLDEMIQTKSRQEIMEIILGGMATEFICEPKVTEGNDDTEKNVFKRKINGVADDQSDDSNHNILMPKKLRKISLSEEITSTTDTDADETSNQPTNSIQSKFIGKVRRVGLPRPKMCNKVTMSPSSDQSLENYVQNSQIEKKSPILNGVMSKSMAEKKTKFTQRYDTSDLYKPKLHFLSKRHITQ